MEGVELKHCPLCGSKEVNYFDASPFLVYCEDCGCQLTSNFDFAALIAQWNERTFQDAIQIRISALEKENAELKKGIVGGSLSDGYHTIDELYHQRVILFAALCNLNPERAWKSKEHHDGVMYAGGWFICGINTPEGPYTYHHKLEYWDLFQVQELKRAPQWDGHTHIDVSRLLSLVDQAGETI